MKRNPLAFQTLLRSKFEELKFRNPAYSLRAFAKKTGVSPAILSLVFNGKRVPTQKLMAKIAGRLLLDPREESLLLTFPSQVQDLPRRNYLQLRTDQYQVLADWRCLTFLNLIETKGFRNDLRWIARRLRSTPKSVQALIESLKRLEMLEESADGAFFRRQSSYRTTDDLQNLSLRKSHYSNLDLAREALDEVPIESRDFTWVVLPMDKRKLAIAKNLIRKFHDDFMQLVEKDSEPDEVYKLCVQLFPMTETLAQATQQQEEVRHAV